MIPRRSPSCPTVQPHGSREERKAGRRLHARRSDPAGRPGGRGRAEAAPPSRSRSSPVTTRGLSSDWLASWASAASRRARCRVPRWRAWRRFPPPATRCSWSATGSTTHRHWPLRMPPWRRRARRMVGRSAADLVFLREGLEAVPLALAVARRAAGLVRENLALAVLYNVVRCSLRARRARHAASCRGRDVVVVDPGRRQCDAPRWRPARGPRAFPARRGERESGPAGRRRPCSSMNALHLLDTVPLALTRRMRPGGVPLVVQERSVRGSAVPARPPSC